MIFQIKIGYVTVFHPFEVGADRAQDVYESGLILLKDKSYNYDIYDIGHAIFTLEESIQVGKQFQEEAIDVLVIRLATWSSDEILLDILSKCDVPVINWGIKDINSGSMCGSHQFNAVLKELNKKSIIIYEDSIKSLERIHQYSMIQAIIKDLRQSRFGLIGIRTQGMAEIITDEYSIKEIFGPRIISVSIDSFKRIVESKEGEEVSSVIKQVKKNIKKISINEIELENAVKNYLALKDIIKRKKLSGVTIGCYPNYMGKVCLGFSLLSDEGIVCACEADLNSLILMKVMYILSGGPVQHIDPLLIDENENIMIGSHCGSNSMTHADASHDISIEYVRLANTGACLNFASKSGNITMANLIGRKNTYRLCIIKAEALTTDISFPGNPIKIKFPFPIDYFLKVIEEWGFGHHWVIAYGDISKDLELIAQELNIKHYNFDN